MQTIVADDPEIRQFVESLYQVEIKQYIVDFYEEGKRQGYINPELSTETIMLYSKIIRKGMAAESSLSEDPRMQPQVDARADTSLSLWHTGQAG